MLRQKKAYLYCLIGSGLLGGCTITPSSYTPYPQQMAPVRQAVSQGSFDVAIQGLQDGLASADTQLYTLEEARILQLQGNYANSISAYNSVIGTPVQLMQAQLQQGHSMEDIFSAASATNNNDYPYQVQPYEMMLIYQNEAIDYLAQGNLAQALYQFQLAGTLEDYLNQNYMNSVNRLQQRASRVGTYYPKYADVLANTYEPSDIANSLQNGLIDFIGSMAFFDNGDMVGANAEMQRSLAVTPAKNNLLNTQALKLMQMSGQQKQAIMLAAKNMGVTDIPPVNPAESQVWVMLEDAFVPFKQQKTYAITTQVLMGSQISSQTYTMVMPIYGTPPASSDYRVVVGEKKQSFVPVLSVADLAAASLREQYPNQYTAAQLAVEGEFNQLQRDSSQLQVDTSQNNQTAIDTDQDMLSDNQQDNPTPADLRAWSTLPNDIQLAEVDLPAGKHSLAIQTAGGQTVVNCSVIVNKDKIALLWVNSGLQTPICIQLL